MRKLHKPACQQLVEEVLGLSDDEEVAGRCKSYLDQLGLSF
jgi:hypothetical protein